MPPDFTDFGQIKSILKPVYQAWMAQQSLGLFVVGVLVLDSSDRTNGTNIDFDQQMFI